MTTRFRTVRFACVLAGLIGLVSSAQAQFSKPEDAIRYRQGSKAVLGWHFGQIGAMVNGRAPFDAAAAQRHAALVETLAALPWMAFAPGSDKGAPHRAKPAVWLEPVQFKEGADLMQREAGVLRSAAAKGDLDSLRAAFGKTAQSCKGCHDTMRADKYASP